MDSRWRRAREPETLRGVDEAEVLRRLGPRATLSHLSAAKAWGAELLADPPAIDVTVPRSRSRIRLAGVRVHRTDLPGAEVEVRAEIRLTVPGRTTLDVARTRPHVEGVVVADSLLRLGLLDVSELRAAARTLPAGRGRPRAVAVSEDVDPRAGSVLESVARVLLASHGLRPPRCQYEVVDADGAFVGRVDFCWPQARLIVEVDGFAFHADRDSYRRDRRRLNALEQLGWRVLRFSWEDVIERPDYVIAVVRSCLH